MAGRRKVPHHGARDAHHRGRGASIRLEMIPGGACLRGARGYTQDAEANNIPGTAISEGAEQPLLRQGEATITMRGRGAQARSNAAGRGIADAVGARRHERRRRDGGRRPATRVTTVANLRGGWTLAARACRPCPARSRTAGGRSRAAGSTAPSPSCPTSIQHHPSRGRSVGPGGRDVFLAPVLRSLKRSKCVAVVASARAGPHPRHHLQRPAQASASSASAGGLHGAGPQESASGSRHGRRPSTCGRDCASRTVMPRGSARGPGSAQPAR